MDSVVQAARALGSIFDGVANFRMLHYLTNEQITLPKVITRYLDECYEKNPNAPDFHFTPVAQQRYNLALKTHNGKTDLLQTARDVVRDLLPPEDV